MKIGILAVQGAFIEHRKKLEALGVECVELRNKMDLDQDLDGVVLPGGESTVQGKLLHELGMYEELKGRIKKGLPVLATCAGLILLSEKIFQDDTVHFGTMPVEVVRNAYGRQLGSFYTENKFGSFGDVPMTFIRAPYIKNVGAGVEVLAEVDGKIVAAKYGNQIGMSFHPELNQDLRIHQSFVDLISQQK